MKQRNHVALGLLAAALAWPGLALAAKSYCGDLHTHYGPFDYRKRAELNLEIVENAHFTEEVEAGTSGKSSYIGDDLNYTLIAIPNHHRALVTLVKLAQRERTVQVAHMRYPVECYFDRAIRFVPDDATVYALYGNYLSTVGKPDQAMEQLQRGLQLEPDNPTINYNLGLLSMKAKHYDDALKFAQKAYALGFPLQGLKNQLVAAGKWPKSE